MRGLTCGSAAALMALTSCAAPQPELKIRATSASVQADGIAESETRLALGNVALALEGFRKVLRDQPDSIRALTGVAQSYERMGRADLSRKWFEKALAAAPNDPMVLNQFAAFLARHGNSAEASSVRHEAIVAAAAARPTGAGLPKAPQSAAPVDAAEPEPSASVTVALPPPKPVQSAKTANAFAPASTRPARAIAGPHLERLSLGEVALVTRGEPVWRGQLVSSTSRSATFRWVEARPVARLLNAARNEGLAARTRAVLAERGWRRLEIGDAAAVRDNTLVLYPAFRQGTAARLARQFGFTHLRRFDGNEIVVLLGRDAAKLKALRPA